MKKLLALILAASMAFSMVGCMSSNDLDELDAALDVVNEELDAAIEESEAAPAEEAAAPAEAAVEDIAYPERNINMTIPFGAGGGTDLWARVMAEYMAPELGVQIICNNVTGGSAGSTGTDAVWQAAHDGYTMVGTSETPLTIPVMTELDQTTKDWEYFIAAGSPGLLCVNKATYDAGLDSMDAIVAQLTADPESISIAGTQGGLWFALAQLFGAYGDTPFYWVSYPGSGDAILGCHSGEADTVCASAGEVMTYVQSGDLIPVAVMDVEGWEFPGFGEIPAVTDALPALASYLPLKQVLGFAMPADTDPAILAKVTDAFYAAMSNPEVISYAEDQLCVTYGLAGAEAKELMEGLESSLCWILSDMGQTTYTPDEVGIPQP